MNTYRGRGSTSRSLLHVAVTLMCFLSGPLVWSLNLQMNHNRPIRTASGCIDYCCVIQTSEGEDKSPPCTIRTRSLSAGDVRLLVAASPADVVASSLLCVTCVRQDIEQLLVPSLRGRVDSKEGPFQEKLYCIRSASLSGAWHSIYQ